MKKKKLILLIVAIGLLLAGGGFLYFCLHHGELYDKVWIEPGKVVVGNFYPGARAEWPLTIHNGNDQPAEFSLTFLAASGVDIDTGYVYVAAPGEAQDWVIIADPTPVLAAKETKKVLIAVEMPEGATAPPKWEFRVVVRDTTQTGMIQTELTCRWLVTMR